MSAVSLPATARGEQRYARFTQVARYLFLRHGYANTSVDMIVAEAGGSKATLYSYFDTKEELLRTVIGTLIVDVEGVKNLRQLMDLTERELSAIFDAAAVLAKRRDLSRPLATLMRSITADGGIN